MQFIETELPGAVIIEPVRLEDERGFFARTWSASEFEARGLNPRLMQCSLSFNKTKGTIRGMHYQTAPFEEAKLVRCTKGAIFDVVVDLRRSSPSLTRWTGVELTEDNRRMLYVPEGFAHGFQTLADATEVFYQISQVYSPEHARGVRWDDPAFGISWPYPLASIMERDRTYPDFQP